MLDNGNLKDIFNGLVYPNYDKPFECVGTKEEINLSLDMTMDKCIKSNIKLPKLLEKYKYDKKALNDKIKIMSEKWNAENNLPEQYERRLKEYIL
jgi:hypothetical protein